MDYRLSYCKRKRKEIRTRREELIVILLRLTTSSNSKENAMHFSLKCWHLKLCRAKFTTFECSNDKYSTWTYTHIHIHTYIIHTQTHKLKFLS